MISWSHLSEKQDEMGKVVSRLEVLKPIGVASLLSYTGERGFKDALFYTLLLTSPDFGDGSMARGGERFMRDDEVNAPEALSGAVAWTLGWRCRSG